MLTDLGKHLLHHGLALLLLGGVGQVELTEPVQPMQLIFHDLVAVGNVNFPVRILPFMLLIVSSPLSPVWDPTVFFADMLWAFDPFVQLDAVFSASPSGTHIRAPLGEPRKHTFPPTRICFVWQAHLIVLAKKFPPTGAVGLDIQANLW